MAKVSMAIGLLLEIVKRDILEAATRNDGKYIIGFSDSQSIKALYRTAILGLKNDQKVEFETIETRGRILYAKGLRVK